MRWKLNAFECLLGIFAILKQLSILRSFYAIRCYSLTSTALFALNRTNSRRVSSHAWKRNRYPVPQLLFVWMIALHLLRSNCMILCSFWNLPLRLQDTKTTPIPSITCTIFSRYCSLEYSFELNVYRFLVNSSCSVNYACVRLDKNLQPKDY